jgi:hypothetical protein
VSKESWLNIDSIQVRFRFQFHGMTFGIYYSLASISKSYLIDSGERNLAQTQIGEKLLG